MVSAYTLCAGAGWSPDEQQRVWSEVLAMEGVCGLEIPWRGGLSPWTPGWVSARSIQQGPASHLLTLIPQTMDRVAVDPAYGLASPDRRGRQCAVSDVARAFDDVRRLANTCGTPQVRAVSVFSAPPSRSGAASAAALTQSLLDLAAHDRAGAELWVEHCDAPERGPFVKGFLPIAEEISAVMAAAQDAPGIGLSVNWGRSAIEGRSAAHAQQHLVQAAAAGALSHLVFSGCADVPTAFGPAWDDVHVPPRPVCDASTLGPEHVAEAAATVGELVTTGLKIGAAAFWDPAACIDAVRRSVAVVDDAWSTRDGPRRPTRRSGSGEPVHRG